MRFLKLPLSFGGLQKDMRHRYLVLALTAVCVAVGLLCWQRKIHAKSAAVVAPYTAHLTITKNRVLPDGSSANAVSTVVVARDRQGRIYEKTEHGLFIVQDPSKLQTLTWDSHNQVAILARWPYCSGRKGCWADEQGSISPGFRVRRIGTGFPPRLGKESWKRLRRLPIFQGISGSRRALCQRILVTRRFTD